MRGMSRRRRSKSRRSRRRVMRRGMHPGMAAHGHHHIVLVKSPPRLLSRSRLSSFLGEAADAGAEGAAVVGARLQGGDDDDGDGGGDDGDGEADIPWHPSAGFRWLMWPRSLHWRLGRRLKKYLFSSFLFSSSSSYFESSS